jgi:hypothetical protein
VRHIFTQPPRGTADVDPGRTTPSNATATTSPPTRCPVVPHNLAHKTSSLSIPSPSTKSRGHSARAAATGASHFGTAWHGQSSSVRVIPCRCDRGVMLIWHSVLGEGAEQRGSRCETTPMGCADCLDFLQPYSRYPCLVRPPSLPSPAQLISLVSALSYDWSKGHSGVPPAGSNVTKVMLHPVKAEEVQKKPKVGIGR